MKTISWWNTLVLLLTVQSVCAQMDVSYRNNPLGNTFVYDSLPPPILGFMQKINYDQSSNRFEVANKNKTLRLSLGGQVHVVSMFDFNGTVNSDLFQTSLIPIPTRKESEFSMSLYSSTLNLRVDGLVKKRPLVAFVEAGFTGAGNLNFTLRHLYVSYAGFTAGQTWSTFMDLEAAPLTVDGEGPNNEVVVRQPMLRYTFRKNGWQFAAAIEMPMAYLSDTTAVGKMDPSLQLYEQTKHCPDFPVHIKYNGAFGHVQLAGIFRLLNYQDRTFGSPRTVYVPAGGLSLSGTVNVTRKTKIYYQFNGGYGIANYMQDIASFKYDLIPSDIPGDPVEASIMYGGYLSMSRNWSKKWQSNVIFGITRLGSPFDGNQTLSNYAARLYRHAEYLAVNTFWNFIPYGQIGLEYIRGVRVNLNNERGQANRINFMVKYIF